MFVMLLLWIMKTEKYYTTSEVTEMLLKNHIFWDGRPCHLVNSHILKSH